MHVVGVHACVRAVCGGGGAGNKLSSCVTTYTCTCGQVGVLVRGNLRTARLEVFEKLCAKVKELFGGLNLGLQSPGPLPALLHLQLAGCELFSSAAA